MSMSLSYIMYQLVARVNVFSVTCRLVKNHHICSVRTCLNVGIMRHCSFFSYWRVEQDKQRLGNFRNVQYTAYNIYNVLAERPQ